MSDLRKNALEWSVFGVSCVLVLSLLGFLGYTSWNYVDSPTRIEIHFGKPERIGKSWQLPLEIENKGGHAAEAIEIEVEWPRQKQSAHFVLAHLPRYGKRTGAVVFDAKNTKDLPVSELEAHVAGYEDG